MKFNITMKDPDGVYDSVTEAAKESVKDMKITDLDDADDILETRTDSLMEIIGEWFKYGEYLTVEVDTETKTIKVV